MAIIKCSNNRHIYDDSEYSSCPHCANEGYRIDFFGNAGGVNRPGVTQALNKNQNAQAFSGQSVGKTVAATEGFKPDGFKPVADINKTVAVGLDGRELERGSALLPVTGWLVCIKGPNAGRPFEIHSDYNYLGSEEGDIVIPGDHKISRKNQLRITYDSIGREFFIAPMEGANLVRLNGRALIGGEKLEDYDRVDMGDSSFMFISFCSEKFDWSDVDK